MYPRQCASSLCAIAFFLFAILSAACGTARGQELGAIKFDQFEDMKADDIQARLDLFAEQLNKQPASHGFIVGYRPEDQLPGSVLRDLHGYRDYLVNKRGIEPERSIVIDEGIAEKRMTILWLYPTGSSPPKTPGATKLQLNGPMQFDRLYRGPGCWSEFTLALEDLNDAVRFFSSALQENPATKGYILVHPSIRGSLPAARKVAESSRKLAVNKYGIAQNRMVASIESPRYCQEVDFWVAPKGLTAPTTASIESFFNIQLLVEAEQNQYTVRRVEFIGNQQTRDKVLRRRISSLQEGQIFATKVLGRNLASLSRLRSIKPAHLEDVDVYLNRSQKLIDLTITVTERIRRQ